jgi:beta-phosphoglucomutase-like phosphatase (HAD superfamily)
VVQLDLEHRREGAGVVTTVASVLAETSVLLLDFDGPVCGIFATTPDYVAANRVRRVVTEHGIELPPELTETTDPMAVLTHFGQLGDTELTKLADDELTRAELDAVRGATPTPFAHDVIRAFSDAGRPVVIVSNNSADAIAAYLDEHNLARYVLRVFGRPYGKPELMKPTPYVVELGFRAADASPTSCVLVGDSVTDVEAAHAAGTRSIGYANRDPKIGTLAVAGADAVITSMEELLTALD